MSVAIVTGASSGLGLAIARALAGRGYAIVANSRGISQDHPSIAEIGAERIVAVAGNVGERDTAERVLDAALSRFDGVDLLVNNAGVFIPKPFAEYTAEDFETLLTTNVRGFFNLTQSVLKHMAQHGHGHVVNITTSLAENPLKAVPSVLPILTKGGLNAATRALALEYAGTGVRINAVSPGIIRTPMHAETNHAFLATLHPVGRMGDPEDVARGVLYLEDAPFVTGEILHVDGGAWSGRW
jgi:NAD(P)-dependent dehydrogenase (short-subunit alcohol dehydrogenase family)